MEDNICSVCSSEGAKKCSRCKTQYYCGKECQRKDYKMHREICILIWESRHIRQSVDPIAGIPESIAENPMATFGTELLVSRFMSKFHEEYNEIYPKEKTFYGKLKDQFRLALVLTDDFINHDLSTYTPDERDKMKRWGHVEYKQSDLHSFLESNPKPGDIFTKSPDGNYGIFGGLLGLLVPFRKGYQTMRNTPVHSMEFQTGKAYVSVGFVDMFQLISGSFVSPIGLNPNDVITFVGYDKSELVVARNLVIYQMMLSKNDPKSILQVWFSSGWSKKTLNDFQRACQGVINNLEKSSTKNEMQILIEVIKFWKESEVPMRSVIGLWTKDIQDYVLDPLYQLASKTDRMDYARYIATGHIFGETQSDYEYGNATFFCFVDMNLYNFRVNESIFTTFSLDELPYNGSLLLSIKSKIISGLKTVRDVVQSFGKIRYLVFIQDSLTPLPPSFYLVRIFPNYVRFKHQR